MGQDYGQGQPPGYRPPQGQYPYEPQQRYLPSWPPQGQQPYQPPPQPRRQAPPRRKRSRGGLAFLGCGGLGALVVLIALLAYHPSTPAPTTSAPPSESVIAPGTAPALEALTIGHFPATTDGKLAEGICEQWQGLRSQYAQRLTIDTPYQMNQWFSSADWAKVQSDGAALGDDPAYSNLETSLGVATVGDEASAASAAAVDKACERAD